MPDDEVFENFEDVHRAYQENIYEYILARVQDQDDAADLTVELFINTYRAWKVYKARHHVSVDTWLFACADNNIKNYLKEKERGLKGPRFE